jgi:hypothetical protein
MLWLRELVSAGLDSGSLALVDGMWRWRGPSVLATRLIELIEHRVECMPPDEAEVMELVAYGEPIAAALLSRLVTSGVVRKAEARSCSPWPTKSTPPTAPGQDAHEREPTVSSARAVATMSGTPANICVQLRATCLLPVNVWFGWTGCSGK